MHKTGFQGGICFKPDNGGKLQQKGGHIDSLLLSVTDNKTKHSNFSGML